MAERLGSGEEKQMNPLQRAVNRFEKRVTSGQYDASSIQRALDEVRNTGAKLGATSPGELYATLAALSGMAVDLAGQHGNEAEQKAFAEQQEAFSQTSEQLSQGSGIVLPTSPSQPQRTTGRAAG